jgi:rare lipoprotein A
MRRRLWLCATAWWLLQLGACGDQPSAKSPNQVGSQRAERVEPIEREPLNSAANTGNSGGEAREIAGEAPRRGRDGGGAHELGSTSDELAQRYAKARALAVLSGSGSYYSDAFAGRATASGAAYEPRGFTAAHRSLPFGTVLRVTRVDGGQSVYVRVTDRGPFGSRGRILDLSRAAAERLAMLRAGVAKLRVEVVEYGPRKKKRRRRR